MSPLQSCTLYLDSAGDPGWPPPFGKSKLQWYVVAGVALTPEADLHAYEETDKILKKYIPSTEWHSPKFELCYHDLIRGKGIYSTLSHPQRLSMANEVFDLLLNLEPVLFATAINKLRLKQRYGANAYPPKSLSIRATIHRFAMFLKRKNMVGSVIMDEEEYRKDRKLQLMVRTFKRKGIIIRGWAYQPIYVEKIDRVLNTINFTPSVTTPGIQLADFCSRSVWQHFERGKSRRFHQLSPLWDRSDSIIYEPSVFPK